ncbi:hypothetical protein [Amnibacterium endophyticum]|uniref:Cell division protein CrgA n=1 Tax=Amnibacterium endophyticum TaxID=2109337 RepID=A0ABW4LHB7_9MICO
MAADDEQWTDELVLRDLPGKLAVLVFTIATLALVWEVWGVLFNFGSFPKPLAALEPSDLIGVGMFTTGWLVILVGLLVLRHRRHSSTS